MTIEELEDRIAAGAAMRQFRQQVEQPIGQRSALQIRGVSGSLLAFVVADAAGRSGGIQVLVAEDRDAAAYLTNDLCNLRPQWRDGGRVLLFPTAYKRSVQSQREDPAGIVQRTAVLSAVRNFEPQNTEPLLICTYPEALVEQVVGRTRLGESTLQISAGDQLAMDQLEERLLERKFQRVDFVGEPGQYSSRGGIVDIFSFGNSYPYRIDFFGDVVDSIRVFNVGTQLSVSTTERVEIVPNLKNEELAAGRVSFAEYICGDTASGGESSGEGSGEGSEAGGVTLWLTNAVQALARLDQVRAKLLHELQEPGTIDNQVTSRAKFLEQTASWRWIGVNTAISERPVPELDVVDFGSAPQPQFNKHFDLLVKEIRQAHELSGRVTHILTENYVQMERLENVFEAEGLSAGSRGSGGADGAKGADGPWGHIPLTLHGGFVMPQLQVALYTDHQIFDRYHRYTVPGQIDRRESMTIAELNSLEVGDYVVHIDHGVGRFGGLVHSTKEGVVQEFVKLVYRDNDILFVNVHSLHRISKYKDKDAVEPKVNKLGSGAWQKLKATAKARVKDMARELIALYAKRKASTGFAFSPDGYMQQELEASFMYEDTPDQQRTTADVKADMEAPVPMDRLICGDVGFGKTEVAIRAAFKAVGDGKQVAVLVPTTILALQHYRTFSRRLKEFPVRIELLSRTKTARQTREILDELKAGKIDILIGTHKLLSPTVEFKDLGLLVVDEEQKFGVASKEKLRQVRSQVDTLTLTATPIPRTLQFSLMGARDLSIINTPPPNRQPVATQVDLFHEEIIAEAIEAEVGRGGQVFFLHNRVQSLGSIAALIQRLNPTVRVGIGHGQMPAAQLERVMMGFIYGEYDVLLATTIIESGIDIPNANTIIIDHAHRFGLSDLHQLRGRVGRTNRKAYCYLLIPSQEAITDDAHRRLRALEEFSDLGSGFHIAMQDLDIRGAGNILGAQQSGFIADIGYETYQKIMEEAVAELRQEQGLDSTSDAVTAVDTVIETDSSAHLPDAYIGNTAEKLRLYRELDGIRTQEALTAFIGRLADRFGEPPAVAEELFDVVRLRQVAQGCGIERIVLKGAQAHLYFLSNPNAAFFKSERFMTLLRAVTAQGEGGRLQLRQYQNKLSLQVKGVDSTVELRELLERLLRA